MDYNFYRIVLIDLDTKTGTVDHICNHYEDVVVNSVLYTSDTLFEVGSITNTTSMSGKKVKVSGLQLKTPILQNLANAFPYPNIEVTIKTADLVSGVFTNIKHVYRGDLYSASPKFQVAVQSIGLTLRDFKYFADRNINLTCDAQCAAPTFGDSFICTKTITTNDYTISTINNTTVTVSDDTSSIPNGSYNAGYLESEGIVLGIRYWVSGNTFQLTKAPPSSWLNKVVSFYFGCNRSLNSCRNIHNNEARFTALGYGMVDYDVNFEIN